MRFLSFYAAKARHPKRPTETGAVRKLRLCQDVHDTYALGPRQVTITYYSDCLLSCEKHKHATVHHWWCIAGSECEFFPCLGDAS